MTSWNPLSFLRTHPAEWRQALRVVIAVAVTLLAINLLNVPQGYWAVITAVIVVQTSIGGSLKAALDRLWGTLAGAAVGALVAITLPHSTPVEIGLVIIVAVIPLAYLAAVNPAFRVAPVTAVIMLVPSYGPHAGDPVTIALDRVFEIALGNVVALVVSLFVFPARAHEQLRIAAAKVVTMNAELMDALDRRASGGNRAPGRAADPQPAFAPASSRPRPRPTKLRASGACVSPIRAIRNPSCERFIACAMIS